MLETGCLLASLLSSWILLTCYDNIQYKGKFCYIGRTYPHWPPPMVFLELYGVSIYPLATCAEIKTCRTVFMWVSISGFMPIQYMNSHSNYLVFSIPIWLLCSELITYFLKFFGYYNSSAYQYNTICHCHVISECQILAYFLWFLISPFWPTSYDVLSKLL